MTLLRPAVTMQRALATAPPRHTCFHSGTEQHPVYVDFIPAEPVPSPRLPIVMLHGAFHTGVAYLATPDGREGWAQYFAKRGHNVYVPDWPGHGRSPLKAPLATLSTRQAAQALLVLVRSIGPSIIFAHSAAGPMAWWMAEQDSDAVAAVVGLAAGPPANILPPLPDDPKAIGALRSNSEAGCPVYSDPKQPVEVGATFIREFWASSPRFPKGAEEAYAKSIVPESSKILNERFNIGGAGLGLERPEGVSRRPILVVTGDCDLRHPRAVDARLADYLAADFLWLPDAGCIGNGHMLMLEDNSDEIASLIARWLDRRGL